LNLHLEVSGRLGRSAPMGVLDMSRAWQGQMARRSRVDVGVLKGHGRTPYLYAR